MIKIGIEYLFLYIFGIKLNFLSRQPNKTNGYMDFTKKILYGNANIINPISIIGMIVL